MNILGLAVSMMLLSGCCVGSRCYFDVNSAEEQQARKDCLRSPRAHEQCEIYLRGAGNGQSLDAAALA